ncbi:putative cullin protein, neddylation [Tanacetum coccineum]
MSQPLDSFNWKTLAFLLASKLNADYMVLQGWCSDAWGTLWVDNIINYDKIEMKLKAALLETVQRDREGGVVNRDMMRNTLIMLVKLGLSVYQEEFEKPFLDLSTSFYRGKFKQLIRCCDCGEYLKEAENCLDGEIKRVSDYLLTCDVKTSFDTMKGFYEDTKPADGPRLCVHVLSTGSWPSQLTRSTTCNLPPEIIHTSEKFRTYYLGIHKRHKLTWQTNMGSAAIKVTFGTKQYELSVSTYQMCVLMLFNNAEQLSYKEIQQAVEIPTMELKRCLQSLACAAELEKNVMRMEPISTHINNDEMFSSKCSTVKTVEKDRKQQIDALISDMAGSGTEAAHKEQDPGKLVMVQNLEVGRKPQIDASILKIMKANGIMNCNDLVREVTKQLQSRIRTNSSIIKRIITLLTDWATCKGTQKMEICFDTQFEGKNDIVEFYGD